MRILLHRYHPLVDDIALTFCTLGHSVDVCVNTSLSDHYGGFSDILSAAAKDDFYLNKVNFINLKVALSNICCRKYDLVGVDGVFSGDQILIDLCNKNSIPFFCIQSYPNTFDKPSNNILSLGWSLPFFAYNSRFPSEGDKKHSNWKHLNDNCSEGYKNIVCFYPNFWKLKQKLDNKISRDTFSDKLVTSIHSYGVHNKYSYECFKKFTKHIECDNITNLSQDLFHEQLLSGKYFAFLMLKWADQPGIALLEAMLCGLPVFTLNSYILASFNQDVLIDEYNCISRDTLPELISDCISASRDKDFIFSLGQNASNHAKIITSFDRQSKNLDRFLKKCLQ